VVFTENMRMEVFGQGGQKGKRSSLALNHLEEIVVRRGKEMLCSSRGRKPRGVQETSNPAEQITFTYKKGWRWSALQGEEGPREEGEFGDNGMQ